MILESILLPHQVEDKRFIQKTRYCIVANAMGLGKSLSALSVTNQARKIVITAPAYLRPNWKKELSKWLTEYDRFLIVSYEAVLKNGDEIFKDADIVIIDEAHYAKTVSAKRTKALHTYIKKYKPKALILLTGTPIKSRVPEFYSLLMLCSYGNEATARAMAPYFNYWAFAEHFSWGEEVSIGGSTTIKYSGHRNLEELKKILDTCYIRRLKMEVDLPEMREKCIYFKESDMPEGYREEVLKYFETGKASSHLSSMKAENALATAPHTVKFVTELTDSGEVDNVVIFTDHIKSSEAIAKALGVTAVNSTLSIDARGVIVDRFIQGLDKYLVATIGTLSTGVNLVNCSTMVFNDISWVSGDLEQAKKRIHRIGQERDCNYFYMTGESPVAEYILKTVKAKAETIEQVV